MSDGITYVCNNNNNHNMENIEYNEEDNESEVRNDEINVLDTHNQHLNNNEEEHLFPDDNFDVF